MIPTPSPSSFQHFQTSGDPGDGLCMPQRSQSRALHAPPRNTTRTFQERSPTSCLYRPSTCTNPARNTLYPQTPDFRLQNNKALLEGTPTRGSPTSQKQPLGSLTAQPSQTAATARACQAAGFRRLLWPWQCRLWSA